MNGFRALDLTFGLSLAFAVLVLPLASSVGRTELGLVAGPVASALVAVGILARTPTLENGAVWRFGGLTFLVAAGVHLLAGTGANAGEASPAVVVGVWVVAVLAAGAVVARRR
ncbi:hypothetical protein [Halorussus halobius]|uniref:hypothetical protein n=1 Tax=Halorussus halobius TaxID=1710537 RepID=UPI001091A106|nr:hypothetical protein [Halorussus halobius]